MKEQILTTAPNVPAQELAVTANLAPSITVSSASTAPCDHLAKSNGQCHNGIRFGVARYILITKESPHVQYKPDIKCCSDCWLNKIRSG